jgi:hypothetical protein
MKNIKFLLIAVGVTLAAIFMISADHIEAPAVSGTTSDITDFYCFQGEDTDNLVFVANVQGLLSPTATADATFDENVLVEFNIDNNGDAVEDLVIQAIPRDGRMFFFGPFAPTSTGLQSSVNSDANSASVEITEAGESAIIEEENDLMVFAGPRDDPFFMDFSQFTAIVGGNAASFNDPGADTFAGTNVMSIIVEVPKSMLGSADTINTWVESKRR